MTQTQQISLQQFVESFQAVVNKPIWRVIHPADGWLIIDIGQKYIDTIPGKDGVDEPYDKGQCQLYITGNWEVYSGNKLIETRKVNGVDQKTYFNRMDKLVTNFPIKIVESVKLDGNILIISGNSSNIRVSINRNAENISLTEVELNQSNKPISYTHYRYEKEIGDLARISTKL